MEVPEKNERTNDENWTNGYAACHWRSVLTVLFLLLDVDT